MAKETGTNSIHDGQAYRREWSENQKAARDEVSDLQAEGIGKVTTTPETYLSYINAQAMNPHMSAGNIAAALVQNKNVEMMATAKIEVCEMQGAMYDSQIGQFTSAPNYRRAKPLRHFLPK